MLTVTNKNNCDDTKEEIKGIRRGILWESRDVSHRPHYYSDVDKEVGDGLIMSVAYDVRYIDECLQPTDNGCKCKVSTPTSKLIRSLRCNFARVQ